MGQFGEPCPKPLPRSLDKRQAKLRAERDDRAMKAAVKARDGYACRCCGRKDSVDAHEHKRRGAGGIVSLTNSYAACRLCHDLLGPYRIHDEMADGAEVFDANKPIRFVMSQRIADLVFPHGRIPQQVHVVSEGV